MGMLAILAMYMSDLFVFSLHERAVGAAVDEEKVFVLAQNAGMASRGQLAITDKVVLGIFTQ